MVECVWELDCANAGSAKCGICHRIAEVSRNISRYAHYPAFKDKLYYMKTIPYLILKPLFER